RQPEVAGQGPESGLDGRRNRSHRPRPWPFSPLYRFNLIAWCLTWGLCDQLRRLVVLVDHATEDLSPSGRQVQRRAGLAVLGGRSLLAGLGRGGAGVVTGSTPSLAKIVSKALVNLASRSRIRKRKEPIRSPRSMIRLRACCAVHTPSGWAVTPRTRTRRVLTSMTNSTYRRLRKIVSTWKKSQANRPSV